MNITIKTTGIELTPAIERYVREKLAAIGQLLRERGDRKALAEVEVGKITEHHRNGDVFKAEVNLSVSGDMYRAEETTGDLYASIDAMKDSISEAVVQDKDRKIGLFRRGARAIKGLLQRDAPIE